ncbi:tetratricopeptide repeat protein 12-like isoform X2 [Apis mellifera]|uniref:Tetratricopeptide repeat protein 12-like isoform X2 n=1 Tax=Apis mellifera TaxID=7460 RepID=A0A7M7GY20_APIME|nr:tetratricopeptide repeat protein 12-like isoform X2 [Apis mellifera]|eukprot:XP_006565808.1 tetratricopeptide repeat protein 12-like isoform X2 [Apis mellifera]
MDKTEDHDILKNKITEGQKIMDNLSVDKHVTEEEFQNFMQRVTEVEKIVKKLASSNPEEQEHGQILADEILDGRAMENIICDDTEVKIKMNRTVINKCSINENSTDEEMSKEAFMKSVEKDAKERAENRKIRNERAETLKTIGNGAFKEGNYEKALGLFEKALNDCEWALKVNNTNLKALLNSAKCYKQLGDETKYKEYILLAKERNPHLTNFINEFEESLEMRVKYQASSVNNIN